MNPTSQSLKRALSAFAYLLALWSLPRCGVQPTTEKINEPIRFDASLIEKRLPELASERVTEPAKPESTQPSEREEVSPPEHHQDKQPPIDAKPPYPIKGGWVRSVRHLNSLVDEQGRSYSADTLWAQEYNTIAAYNSKGKLAWSKPYQRSDCNPGRSGFAQDKTSLFLASNAHEGPPSTPGPCSPGNLATLYTKHYLLKVNKSDGSIVWERFGKEEEKYNQFTGLSVSPADGSLYATGIYTSKTLTFDQLTLTKETSKEKYQYFLIKFDAKGKALWAKNINDDYPVAVASKEGVFVRSGSSSNTQISFWSSDGLRKEWTYPLARKRFRSPRPPHLHTTGDSIYMGARYSGKSDTKVGSRTLKKDSYFILSLDQKGKPQLLWQYPRAEIYITDVFRTKENVLYITGSITKKTTFGNLTLTPGRQGTQILLKVDSQSRLTGVVSAQNRQGTSASRIDFDGANLYTWGLLVYLPPETFGPHTFHPKKGESRRYLWKIPPFTWPVP